MKSNTIQNNQGNFTNGERRNAFGSMGIALTRTATPRDALHEVVQEIEGVLDGHRIDLKSRDETTSEAMNVEPTHSQDYAPVITPSALQTHDRRTQNAIDIPSNIVPPILKNEGGLASIPQDTLKENLRPIMRALRNLDAELLLDLQPSPRGPKVREGRYCRPIYDDVQPAVARNDPSSDQSCVRYLHIAEVPDQYSIGVFVFAPFSRIPLHDHPEMCVLSRVLYGDLQRSSLDLAQDEESGMSDVGDVGSKNRWTKWFNDRLDRSDSFRRKLPKGSRRAYKNHVDFLQAPDVTALYPYEGNLHEFVAGPDGAAVLDILLPPYDNVQNRDCTFFEIQELTSSCAKPPGKEPCYITPTGQPENFHCISGQYRDLGESDDYD